MSASFDRRITAARPDLAAAHLSGRVEAARFVEGVRHAVIAPAAPLRRDPRPDLGLDTELLFGECFVTYDRDAEGWSWGQGEADGYVGWLPSALLGPADPPAATHKVVTLRTFVYPEPSIKTPPALVLPLGARLVVEAEQGPFSQIAEGYIWTGHLAAPDAVAADFVAVAEMLAGVPYLWGGRTSLGLDCSGLVQTSLAAAGRAAPRDSDMQERALGIAVDVEGPLQRGDLVFWRGHVGIMRDPARLLHANGHSMTVETEDLAAARRRIAASGDGAVTGVRRFA